MPPGIRERIYAYIADKGLRKTTQRDAIIEAAFSTTEHYTADDLLVMARKVDRSVSRATVYRTLPLLVECGVLKEMDFGKDYKFYDPNYIAHPHHNHLICVDCSKIVEFEDQHIELLEDCISKRLGFLSRLEEPAHRGQLRRAAQARRLRESEARRKLGFRK